jgi:hypothetical protein
MPASGAFIKRCNLTGAGLVKTSLKALSDKEMIIRPEDSWMVADLFFSRWLEYQYGNTVL